MSNSRDEAAGHASPRLTPSQQAAVERARKVANSDAHHLVEPGDFTLGNAFVFGVAFQAARDAVAELLGIIDDLTGGQP